MNARPHRFITRRSLMMAAAAALAGPPLASGRDKPPRVDVWKDPNCGCCAEWVRHLQANGFEVQVHDTGNAAMRARLGVATKYGSCHTAVVDGYAVEGHVPAREIRRLLKERPTAIGLAVPGMPIGSPGMDGPEYKGRKDAYDVLLLVEGGGAKVFQRYG